MEFTAADRQSPTWQKLKAHYAVRLQTYRTQNDGMQSDLLTSFLRGRIQEVKTLLTLDQDERPLTETPTAKE